MPAHEPDETTGAARRGRAPGRHRHDQPGAATREPADDLPPPARPRHARGGEPSDPAATRRRYDDTGLQPVVPGGGSGYGADPHREAAAYGDNADYSDGTYSHDAYGNDAYGNDAYGNDAYSNDAYSGGGYDDWYGGDPEADSRSSRSRGAGPPRTTFHRDGRQGSSPHQDDPYRGDPYPDDRYDDPYADDPFADDPYTDPRAGDRYSGDPYQDDPHTGDRYQAAPGHTRRRGSDPYSAAGYGTDTYRADTYGPDTYSGDPYAGSNGSGAGRNGTADQTDGQPSDQDRYGVGPPASRSTAFGATDAEPEITTTGGRERRPGPDRRRLDQGSRALPSRRPGDPPGVPAELFVETTAETRALRFDDEPPSPTPDAAEAAPERPRSGGRRILGIPVSVPLPAWARRLIPERQEHGQAHGHGHGHGPTRPAGRRVRILIAALLVPCALATLVGVVLLWPSGGPPATAQPVSQEPVRAQVTATSATDCSPGSGNGGCVALVVHMADGPRPDRDLVQVVPVEPGSPQFSVGDQIVLGWSGADPDDAGSYQVIDFQRGAPLAWLAGLFAAAVLLLGRWRGLAALVALALSFVVLLFFVVPAILAGHNPLAVAVVGACLIMFAVLYLTHGPSARTSTAVLGTLLSLALIGALSAAFSAAAQLTGLDDQTRNLIASLGTGVDARGLLLAGVVIGALGVLDDVTVTQTSAVWELRHANPDMSARGLFAAAMRIGRDHVASAVNTLVLAYAGAALPLLLLFSLSRQGFGNVVTSQDVATEVVRTLVGSIGLVASVPITTALAAAVAARETVPAAEKAG